MNTPLNLESLSFYFDCMKLERARYEINFTTMSRSLLNDQCDAPCFGFPRGCDRSMSVIVIADPIFFATCRTASSVELSLDSPIPEISTEFRRLYCVDCSRYAVLCSTLDCSSPTFARKSAFPFSSVSTFAERWLWTPSTTFDTMEVSLDSKEYAKSARIRYRSSSLKDNCVDSSDSLFWICFRRETVPFVYLSRTCQVVRKAPVCCCPRWLVFGEPAIRSCHVCFFAQYTYTNIWRGWFDTWLFVIKKHVRYVLFTVSVVRA